MPHVGRVAQEQRGPAGRGKCRVAVVAEQHRGPPGEARRGQAGPAHDRGQRVYLDADQRRLRPAAAGGQEHPGRPGAGIHDPGGADPGARRPGDHALDDLRRGERLPEAPPARRTAQRAERVPERVLPIPDPVPGRGHWRAPGAAAGCAGHQIMFRRRPARHGGGAQPAGQLHQRLLARRIPVRHLPGAWPGGAWPPGQAGARVRHTASGTWPGGAAGYTRPAGRTLVTRIIVARHARGAAHFAPRAAAGPAPPGAARRSGRGLRSDDGYPRGLPVAVRARLRHWRQGSRPHATMTISAPAGQSGDGARPEVLVEAAGAHSGPSGISQIQGVVKRARTAGEKVTRFTEPDGCSRTSLG